MNTSKETRLSRGDRVSIDKSVHDLYRELTEKSSQNPEFAPFHLMKDVFMWALAMGVKSGRRMPLEKREQIFRWDQFSERDVAFLRAIAIAETGDVEVIVYEGRILAVAEEYANGGIIELKHELVDRPGQPLWNLVELIRS